MIPYVIVFYYLLPIWPLSIGVRLLHSFAREESEGHVPRLRVWTLRADKYWPHWAALWPVTLPVSLLLCGAMVLLSDGTAKSDV